MHLISRRCWTHRQHVTVSFRWWTHKQHVTVSYRWWTHRQQVTVLYRSLHVIVTYWKSWRATPWEMSSSILSLPNHSPIIDSMRIASLAHCEPCNLYQTQEYTSSLRHPISTSKPMKNRHRHYKESLIDAFVNLGWKVWKVPICLATKLYDFSGSLLLATLSVSPGSFPWLGNVLIFLRSGPSIW